MGTLSDIQVTDDVTDNLATYHNRLLGGIVRSDFSNVETISGTKELGDTDYQIQILTPSGADRDVELSPLASTNHITIIYNSGSNNLVVKDDTGATTFITLAADEWAVFVPVSGEGWKIIENRATLKKYFDTIYLAIYPAGYLYGLTLSNNGSDAVNDIDIAVGNCRDSSNTVNMILGSALTKKLDANWAAGTNQGMRNSGAAIANTTYHIYLVCKSDGTGVDIYAHTSTTVATVLAALQAETGGSAYTYVRRIGSIVRASAAILLFKQDGDMFIWDVPTQDISATNPGTSAVTATLTVPLGIRVRAYTSVYGASGGVSTDNPGPGYVSDLSITDSAPSLGGVFNFVVFNGGAVLHRSAYPIMVYTNTSGQVRYRIGTSTASTTVKINTLGWEDKRDRV